MDQCIMGKVKREETKKNGERTSEVWVRERCRGGSRHEDGERESEYGVKKRQKGRKEERRNRQKEHGFWSSC